MADAHSFSFDLTSELRLHVLSFLPPNDLALSGRLSSKDAAQRFSELQHRTACLSQPLPRHIMAATDAGPGPGAAEGAEGGGCTPFRQALRAAAQLSFRQKLLLLSTAATSGRKTNVGFAWRLLQPHVFPELLQTESYMTTVKDVWKPHSQGELPRRRPADVGSAAVASGLAHLLPSLAQRCPVLLDPGAILEEAARHCDLAGLQAAWEAVGQRLCGRPPMLPPRRRELPMGMECLMPRPDDVCQRVMVAAACSLTSDATAKMAWVLDTCRYHSRAPVEHAEVWGAAAASGDLARLRWLEEQGCIWWGTEALAAVLRHADLGFIVQMEGEGGYLPPADDEFWRSKAAVCAAAGSARDSAPKLRLLADRGAEVGTEGAVQVAAQHGNLEALKVALQRWQAASSPARPSVAIPYAMSYAIQSGHVQTVACLHQAGCDLHMYMLVEAIDRGDLSMLRWLLEGGCPIGRITLTDVVELWPNEMPADGERLAEALRLLAGAGMAARGEHDEHHLLVVASRKGHPWAVWRCLQQLVTTDGVSFEDREQIARAAVASGNEAVVCAVAELGWLPGVNGASPTSCYAVAAKNGDRGMLACLQRLGLPMGEGALGAAVRQGAPLPALRWLVEHGAATQAARDRVVLASISNYYKWRNQEQQEVQAWLQGLPVTPAAGGGVGRGVGRAGAEAEAEAGGGGRGRGGDRAGAEAGGGGRARGGGRAGAGAEAASGGRGGGRGRRGAGGRRG